jgi:L-fucose mutarotase
MLMGIHPLLTGDLLAALDKLGHGDELVVADANYPAYRCGAQVIEMPGVGAGAVVAALCTVFPLDEHEGPAALLMQTADQVRSDVQSELVAAVDAAPDRVTELERFAFYERAGRAQLILRTGEGRPYGNLVMRKGVVLF